MACLRDYKLRIERQDQLPAQLLAQFIFGCIAGSLYRRYRIVLPATWRKHLLPLQILLQWGKEKRDTKMNCWATNESIVCWSLLRLPYTAIYRLYLIASLLLFPVEKNEQKH